MPLTHKRVLLGISGGIAAYKTPDLVRKLTAQGAEVQVVMSESALEFVSSLSLQAVSGKPVRVDLLDTQAEAAMGHIELAKWADMMVIAPATANCIGKLALGIADDLLTTVYMATAAPKVIAPAMNQQMWQAPAVSRNIEQLRNDGIFIFGPDSGEQACGDIGPGRMLEPEHIVDQLAQLFSDENHSLLANKNIVITAGPTREALDPVRYISNHSSGKMGFAIAEAAAKMGARVTLIAGPVNLATPAGCTRIDVMSADDMLTATMQAIALCDIFIATAAVADYKAQHVAPNKIKKSDGELTLTFTKNPDILKEVANLPQAPFTVGFAAESTDVENYAKQKLAAKNLNMIAANDITVSGLGFNSDFNALHLFWQGHSVQLAPDTKRNLAVSLLQHVATQYQQTLA